MSLLIIVLLAALVCLTAGMLLGRLIAHEILRSGDALRVNQVTKRAKRPRND